MSHWANAKTLPNHDERFALADIAGVRVRWLLEGGKVGRRAPVAVNPLTAPQAL